ncbi:MAG: hypothetical protein FJ304_27730 [Planctomycetes bacterium]|nr:hypothetical protein [Planctomycetota bacterium]
MLSLLSFLCPPLAVLCVAPAAVPKNLLLIVPGVLHARRVVEERTAVARYARLQTILAEREPDSVRARLPATQAA